ncbi:MAG: hypothetical protein F4W92_00790 [Gammaproteobacteria bacterium]|nr:hypothetical protein [Gammaproteobacteria bacterium]
MTLILFSFRHVMLKLTEEIARCRAILERHSAIATFKDHSSLPKKVHHGKQLPNFQAVDIVTGQTIECQSWIGESAIVAFFRREEFEQYTLDSLLVMLRSWWYHVDGKLFVILLDSQLQVPHPVPHHQILQTDVGPYIVLGISKERDAVQTLGLTNTPSAVQLDASGIVRRIGFFANNEGRS